jgi:hypothetical protein
MKLMYGSIYFAFKIQKSSALSPVVTGSFGCQDFRMFLSSSTRHLPSHRLDRIKTGHRLTRLQLETVFETVGTFHRANSFARSFADESDTTPPPILGGTSISPKVTATALLQMPRLDTRVVHDPRMIRWWGKMKQLREFGDLPL